MGGSLTRIIGRMSVLGAVLVTLPLAPPAYSQRADTGYEPPFHDDHEPHSETSEERFGSFTVVRDVQDNRAVPIMHVTSLTKHAELGWRDSTGTIGFTFVDDGFGVQFKAQGKSADGQTTCLMPGLLVGYDPGPGTAENWQKLQPFIHQQLRGCKAIAPANLKRAMMEMKTATADYLAAANAWKSVSLELFGAGGRRCVAERMRKPFTIPPDFECVRYSSAKP